MSDHPRSLPLSEQVAPSDPDPFRRFETVLHRAVGAGLAEPTAMSLATADASGRTSVRMMLLKGVDARGFIFYTNLESRKAAELTANPFAALCFFWQPFEIQVRVEGRVEPVSEEEADAYFASRPRGSQIGAWASRQSRALPAREELLSRVREFEERYENREVPRPRYWSGFRVVPDYIEFWLGRPSRLHHRDVYTRDPHAPEGWRIEQLYP
jgi:pyridoxamine 5'-phosphate oxidase